MNSIEKQLLNALRLTKAETLEGRQAVYEKAMKAARRLPPNVAQKMADEILQAVTNIEIAIGRSQAELTGYGSTQSPSIPDAPIIESNEPPEFASDIYEDGLEKTGLNGFRPGSFFPLRHIQYFLAVGVGIVVVIALVVILATFFEDHLNKVDTQSAAKAKDTQITNPLKTIIFSEFPHDFGKWIESRPQNADTNSDVKIPDDTTLISFDTTFLSTEFYHVDADKDYLVQLKFTLPETLESKALLPILNAGVMVFDADKKPLEGKERFLLSAHKGRLVFGRLVINEQEVSMSGVLSGLSSNPDDGFSKSAAFFRGFLAIRMDKSVIPIELVSYEISAIN